MYQRSPLLFTFSASGGVTLRNSAAFSGCGGALNRISKRELSASYRVERIRSGSGAAATGGFGCGCGAGTGFGGSAAGAGAGFSLFRE